MVIGAHTVFSCATNFLNGRKCVFCGSFKTVKTARSYVKCMLCGKQKASLSYAARLPSCKAFTSNNRLIDWRVIWAWMPRPLPGSTRDCGWFCSIRQNWKALSSRARLSWMSLTLGVQGRVQRGRGARGKSIVFGLLERDGRVYTKVVESVSAQTLLTHIENHTRKGSVYYMDAS
jgi:transposase